MQAIAATISGDTESVLALPEYRALADTITRGDEQLIQVGFMHPVEFAGLDLLTMLAEMGLMPDEAEIDPALVPTPDALPPYELAAMVDWQDGADQVHGVVAVYRDKNDAYRAAEELTTRIANLIAWDLGQSDPIIEQEDIQATMDTPQVAYHADTDRWLAIASAGSPMPDNVLNAEGEISPSGRMNVYWLRSYLYGLFTPLYLPESE